MSNEPCCTGGDCCGPGSYCCANTGPHTHPEENGVIGDPPNTEPCDGCNGAGQVIFFGHTPGRCPLCAGKGTQPT